METRPPSALPSPRMINSELSCTPAARELVFVTLQAIFVRFKAVIITDITNSRVSEFNEMTNGQPRSAAIIGGDRVAEITQVLIVDENERHVQLIQQRQVQCADS